MFKKLVIVSVIVIVTFGMIAWSTGASAQSGFYAYPTKGQSREQQQQDQIRCHRSLSCQRPQRASRGGP